MKRLMWILVICSLPAAAHAAKEFKNVAGNGMAQVSSEVTQKADRDTVHCETPGCTTARVPTGTGGGGTYQTRQDAGKTAVENLNEGAGKDATRGATLNNVGQTPGGP